MFIYLKANRARLSSPFTLAKVALPEGEYYEALFRGAADKRSLRRIFSYCGRLPIACRGIDLPPRYAPLLIDESPFDTLLLSNAFAEFSAGRRALAVDPDGRLYDMLSRPLSRVSTLLLLTGRPDLYDKTVAHYLKTVGSGAVIVPHISDFSGICAVLAPFGTEKLCRVPHNIPIFGIGGATPAGAEVFLRRRRIDRTLAAALYIFYGGEAKNCLPSALFYGGRIFSPEGLRIRLDNKESR